MDCLHHSEPKSPPYGAMLATFILEVFWKNFSTRGLIMAVLNHLSTNHKLFDVAVHPYISFPIVVIAFFQRLGV